MPTGHVPKWSFRRKKLLPTKTIGSEWDIAFILTIIIIIIIYNNFQHNHPKWVKYSLVPSWFRCVPSSSPFYCNFIHHNVWLCVENGILAFWLTYLGLWPVSLTTRLQWSLLIRDIAMQKLTVGLNWKSGACRLGTMGIHVFYSALNEHCTSSKSLFILGRGDLIMRVPRVFTVQESQEFSEYEFSYLHISINW